MRVLLRAAIAIGVILFAAHYFQDNDNLAAVENYKNDIVQSSYVQDFLRVLDDSSIAEQDSMTYHINQLLAE
ncbi:hypothetical protein GT368_13800 [Staphylococcus pseudintermedius]|uniref:hypothetical protein n=1 Tax=Staphylococcus pseudintermedius TaxID=283734 RepID=UPI0013705859|nr:hypothetical protein [Staphylococcus pseudintermedius]MZP64324.1 hypothetical protein [Staphylococcus pseudintermedius]